MIHETSYLKRVCLFVIMLALAVCHCSVLAQTNGEDIPLSLISGLASVRTFESFRVSNTAKAELAIRNNRQEAAGLKSFQFAELKQADLSPENAGSWNDTPYGRVWRLGIRANATHSIYLTFTSFNLTKGTRLFVYNPQWSQLRMYSEKNNAAGGLSLAPISGDSIIIELNMPRQAGSYGILRLSKVYLDVTGLFKQAGKSGYTVSLDRCDQNINCENGINWQTDKRSVCKIITDGALSTGTLIGNTEKDKQPYLLTSYHTIFDDKHAAESIFIFNYEYDCARTAISDQETLSGATLVSAVQGLDYALLKLNEIPPPSYRPYYSGWDVRDIRPERGICIHHPAGKHKQIAIDYNQLRPGTFNQDYTAGSSWQVLNWDIGNTEPGSSGAPLFNPQHRLVGSLTGGTSSCRYAGSDFFNKFSLSYVSNATYGKNIAELLDPLHRGLSFMDGYDPYGFDANVCDTVSHIKRNERKESVITAGTSTDISHKFTMFAERFTTPGYLLLPGFYLDVARLSYSGNTATVRIKIWQGDLSPGSEIYTKTLFLKDLRRDEKNYVTLDSVVKLTSAFFIGYQFDGDLQGTEFAVYHAADRGKGGLSSMYVYDGNWHNSSSLNALNYPTSLAIEIVECYGKTDELKNDGLILFPNPSTSHINFVQPAAQAIEEVNCYDVNGRKYKLNFQVSETATQVFFHLPPGIYVLVVKGSGRQFSSKFIVADQ